MEIKEPTIFKSAKTLQSMTKDSFDGGLPQLKGEVPPIIVDKEEAEAIKDSSGDAGDFIQMLSSSNFFIGLILGGSM